ncbi:hypothetical protein KQI08_02895 [Paraeggerthella hongkongensis]|jgi:hypothetical protein|uniref:hypothetical protein n=1 Tax=Paraeggerthella TaxID=651554 RepID=UPI000DF7F419|nr:MULTISPECIES: hypothetical protein [Paraeggerthella]MBU5404866.1 hypothetical protein [Paraeggerthella hongkongensis]MCD2433146.1 hypothetical protein [Paraeggerthella hominis]RDB59250.1 hypothetical protein C1879_03050 [Paraeggerthella hongkongensis]
MAAGKWSGVAKGAGAAAKFVATHRSEIKAAAEVAAGVAAEVAPKVAPVAKSAADKAAAAARQARASVEQAAQGVSDARTEAKGQKEEQRVRRSAVKDVLQAAAVKLSSREFLESWDKMAGFDPEGVAHYLEIPGCYVILRCKHAVRDDDYSSYHGVYVGSSVNLGASIREHLIGLGNPDVYADVKYRQPVYILAFTQAEGIEENRKGLVDLLGADESYNKPKA